MSMPEFVDLERLVRPGSVAVVGASGKAGSIAKLTVDNLLLHSRYSGKVYLVNPRHDHIGPWICHPDIAGLPEVPDVALICIPAAGVLDALEECAAAGVRFAIVLTSGFGEVDAAGARAQQRMRELAERTGMRIYGPNCPGLTNLGDMIGMTFSPAFADDRTSGPVGLATQGGGLGRNILQAGERGFRAALWASLGNAADLDVPDFIQYLAHDDNIQVIGTLLEGVRDGAKLLRALDIAARANKPVVTLKIGHSDYGERAVRSHTAALAGSAVVNSAVFAQYGVIEVRDIDEIADVCWLLCRAAPPPRTRLAVFGSSGGALALAADLAGAQGLELAELTERTQAALRSVLPAFAAVSNPVDITAASISDPTLLDRTLLTVAEDPNVDAVLAPLALDYGDRSGTGAQGIAEAQRRSPVPILPVWMSDRRGAGWRMLADAEFCAPHSLSKAVLALRRWADHGRWRAGYTPDAPPPLLLDAEWRGRSRPLPRLDTEPRAKRWLAEHGIAVPAGEFAADATAAGAVAERLGGSVVVKAVSPRLAHKSDAGGVLIGIEGGAAATDACARIANNAREVGIELDGVLVERMLPADGVELIVGVHRDATFGPMLSVGLGGLYVEVFSDIARRLLPVDAHQAREMLDELRCLPLLTGARGGPARDVDGLTELLVQVSELVRAHGDRLAELDLNPVLVRPVEADGPSVVVLDALVTTVDDERPEP